MSDDRSGWSLRQDVVPVWGGPAHGEVWQSEQHVIVWPLPLTASAIETAEYQAAKFVWAWRGEWWSARMYLPNDTPAVIEVESVLRFLGGLWGHPKR